MWFNSRPKDRTWVLSPFLAEEFQACSPTAQVSGLSSGEPPTHQEYSIGLWHREEINFF
jgi:hypothetical protein